MYAICCFSASIYLNRTKALSYWITHERRSILQNKIRIDHSLCCNMMFNQIQIMFVDDLDNMQLMISIMQSLTFKEHGSLHHHIARKEYATIIYNNGLPDPVAIPD